MAKIIVIFRNAQQKWSKLKTTCKRHEIMQQTQFNVQFVMNVQNQQNRFAHVEKF